MSLTRILTAALLVSAASVVGIGAGTAHAAGDQHLSIALDENPIPFLPSLFYAADSDESREVAFNTAGLACFQGAGGGDAVCDVMTVTNGCIAVASKGVGYQWAQADTAHEAIQAALHNANTQGVGSSAFLPVPAGLAYSRCTPNAR